MYTPVNEPLTTARFAGLYGLWYPHKKHDTSFVRCLLVQIKAISACMAVIRETIADAQLVQTEDLGYTQSTPPLARQAGFENERRWLTFDLLSGRVKMGHALYPYLLCNSASAAELNLLARRPCPPQLLGINHYITSERWLDDRLVRYPGHTHGGNGRQRYADTETCRAEGQLRIGLSALLIQAWERYILPIAVTEAHLGCTRQEQARWLYQCWQACLHARAGGVDVQAITAWSLLGSYDWNSLMTRPDGHYECGVFDVRQPGGAPHETAAATLVRGLASNGQPSPIALGAGWWQNTEPLSSPTPTAEPAPILILGATGTLGQAFAQACVQACTQFVLADRAECDLGSEASIAVALAKHRPWAVINATGYVRVDDAETDADACMATNADGAARLAHACYKAEVRLVCFSSDLVFDGTSSTPYTEHDAAAPLNVYGASKHAMEQLVLAADPLALVVRTSAFFSADDKYNFIYHTIKSLLLGHIVEVADDHTVTPTYLPELCHAVLDALWDGRTGLLHLAGTGAFSWAALAKNIADATALDANLVQPMPGHALGQAAARPHNAALISALHPPMRPVLPLIERCALSILHILNKQRVEATEAEQLVEASN